MSIEDIIKELEALPNNIKETSEYILRKNEEYSEILETISKIENGYSVTILNEVDDKGKPLYSNAEKRNLALELELSKDLKYKELVERKRKIKNDIELAKIDLENLYNKKSTKIAILNYFSKEK